MIFRYVVSCPGCDSKILLRISVGIEIEQPFYFVCKKCNVATRGKQVIWYQPTPGARIDLEDGIRLDDTTPHDQVVSINPDYPTLPETKSLMETNGSSFLMYHALLGNKFEEFKNRYDHFNSCINSDWQAVRRLIYYYLDRNWEQFDKQGKNILEDKFPKSVSEMHRHDLMHRLLSIMFAPLCTELYYPEMKENWNNTFNQAIVNANEELERYLNAISVDELIDIQRNLFHCLELFVKYKGAIMPGLVTDMNPDNKIKKKLRLFRDEFPALRDLYISTFEACHKTLHYLMAIVNIAFRKDQNKFGPNGPSNLKKFEKLPNAKKADCLRDLDVWDKYWKSLLDRDIRNAIGHHSVRHNLTTGKLVIKNKEPIPYLDFVVMNLRLVYPIQACADAIKIFFIALSIRNNKMKP